MGTFIDRENYLKSLCAAHPAVQHDVLKDDGTRRNSYFRLNDEEELLSATTTGIDYPCVGYIQLNGRLRDVENANAVFHHTWTNGWIFLQHVDDAAGQIGITDVIQQAYDSTFSILEDFIKAMADDYCANGSCGAFTNINFNSFEYIPTGPVMQNAYGWILTFEDQHKSLRI